MRRSRWAMRLAASASVALVGAAMLPTGLAAARPVVRQADAAGPTMKLIAVRHSITVRRSGKQVFIDPGVFVAALGSPLQFDVQRASYASPITITQVIHLPGGGLVRRPLPGWTIDGWQGLRRFLRMTVTNTSGKVVGSRILAFCPNSFNPQRVSPNSPANPLFPQACYSNPFEKGMVWGLQQGWAADPIGGGFPFRFGGDSFKLKPGKYVVTMNVTLMWRRLLHIAMANSTAKVAVTVKKGSTCTDVCPPGGPGQHAGALPKLPNVPLLANPPASALPDMVPLPSWGISMNNIKATKKHPAGSQISFGATVAIEGNARLDVEGFRVSGSPLLQAYQYFWQDGRVIGRARAGTMGFDNKKGHHHWHFQQFAEYRLLNASKSVAVRSRKVGFCIAPTDAIDLVLPHADWQPSSIGIGGACGSPGALWVQEMLPLGWADTYFQSVAGQAFDITHLPNGTYYIEVIANPERVLHEVTYGNDISLRKVIIGGTPGHRTVRVPAYYGIDPEH